MLIGLVGAPSQGKSTLFKALTLAEVEIANYPFTTIKPNSGIGYVKIKDVAKEFGKAANPREGFVLGEFRFVPVQLIDVAGLVPGAHEGKGMGNQFLDDLRQADCLIHVIDVSGGTNEKGESVSDHDPGVNIKFLETELDMWYLGILSKGWEKFARSLQQEKQNVGRALAKQLSGLGVNEDMVKSVIRKLELDVEKVSAWDSSDLMEMAVSFRKLTKPMAIACNKIDLPGAQENFSRLCKEFPDHLLIPCSAESELALKEAAKKELIDYIPGEDNFAVSDDGVLSEQQKKALSYIKENVLAKFNSTGAQKVINAAVFDLLKYKAIHPGGVGKLEDSDGNVLPDCFLMPSSTTALDFAFRLHTDFGKNFVKAIDVRKKLPVGKDHVLSHLDIIEIMSSK